MRIPIIHKKTGRNSLFNVGRSLVSPFFVAAFTYLFLAKNQSENLLAINKVNALVNGLLIFSGWGLKDYLVKESYRPQQQFANNWRLALYSKFLLLVPLLLLSIVGFRADHLPFILAVFLFRTFSQLYEPFILLNKQSMLFFTLEALAALVITCLVWLGIVANYSSFFYLVIMAEAIKLFLCRVMFKLSSNSDIHLRDLFAFLKDTRFYFFLVLVSFFQSKADLYVLGFLFESGRFNEYQLLSSLISLSQIVISSFAVSYSSLVYRNIGTSTQTFRSILLRIGLGVSLASVVLIYVVLNCIYGFDFGVGQSLLAGVNIQLFAFVLFEMFYYTRQNWLHKTIGFVAVCGCANLVLSFLLIKPFAISGALAANTLSALLLAILMRRFRTGAEGYKKI